MTSVQESMPGLAAEVPTQVDPAPLDEARRDAMARAGRLLAVRPRTERELADRLAEAGFPEPVVAGTLERLGTLGLIDDEDFALRWVEERASRKGLSGRVLLHELRAKGISADTAQAALTRAGLDEEAQARELAARYVRRVASKPLGEQLRRIQGMLLRRGYAADVADSAARSVLPPEGWD